jgi:2-dehydropantoate 2-reductase
MKRYRFAFIGAGPVGGLAALHLAQAGEPVALADIKKEHMGAIARDGIYADGLLNVDGGGLETVALDRDAMQVKVEKVCLRISDLAGFRPDFLVIATKASTLQVILPEIERVHKKPMKVIVMQNGIDNENVVAEVLGKKNTFRIVVNYAGSILGDGRFRMSIFHRPNAIGCLAPGSEGIAREAAEVFSRSALETRYVDDIKFHEWRKAILNSALSTVCSISGLTMSEAMAFPPTRATAENILREGIAVARALGYDYGGDFFERAVEYLETSGPHKPSMMLDLEQKLPTEIEFITEKMIEYAGRRNVDTPYLKAVTAFIKAWDLVNAKERAGAGPGKTRT